MEKESCILNQEFVNKFADFLCQEVSENNTYKTKLSVVDCNSLFIIKGYTKNPNVLVLNNLTDKFIEENQDINYQNCKQSYKQISKNKVPRRKSMI